MPPDGLQSRRKADSADGQQKAASLPGAGVRFPEQLKAAAFSGKSIHGHATNVNIPTEKQKDMCPKKAHILLQQPERQLSSFQVGSAKPVL